MSTTSAIARSGWATISAEEYRSAFARFGGSFAVHPRVVALVASLARRQAHYVGLKHKGELIAAVPLWGSHVLASELALKFYRQSDLIDVGHSEVILPITENSRVNAPFKVGMLSVLHANNITNIELEPFAKLTLAKGVDTGERRLSAKSRHKRRQEARRFQDVGGHYQLISELSVEEVTTSYTRLYEKRWGFPPLGKELLPIVLRELKDMLCGYVLLIGDRPVALHLIYRHETPHFVFANGVSQANDPEFREYSLGSILLFRNLEYLEGEAIDRRKSLRFSIGRNARHRSKHKSLWTYEASLYRLQDAVQDSVADDGARDSFADVMRRGLRHLVVNSPLDTPARFMVNSLRHLRAGSSRRR